MLEVVVSEEPCLQTTGSFRVGVWPRKIAQHKYCSNSTVVSHHTPRRLAFRISRCDLQSGPGTVQACIKLLRKASQETVTKKLCDPGQLYFSGICLVTWIRNDSPCLLSEAVWPDDSEDCRSDSLFSIQTLTPGSWVALGKSLHLSGSLFPPPFII